MSHAQIARSECARVAYLVIADDAIVYRCDNLDRAIGYGECHTEQTGEDCEILEVVATAKGGDA